jgi:hypothetical protein
MLNAYTAFLGLEKMGIPMSDPYRTPIAPLSTEANTRRLPRFWNPIAWAVAIAVLVAIESGWFAYVGEDLPAHTMRIWPIFLALFFAWWVYSDRHARGVGMPFEFEAFVVFLWPIVLPYYLYRTRGWWGVLLAAGCWLLYLIPVLASAIVSVAVVE